MQTIEKLAELAKVSGGQEPVVYEKRDAYPLTANQFGVYMACQKDPQALQYNIPFSISLSKTVDIVKLALAIKSVINKHAYIKTHLQEKQGRSFRSETPHGTSCFGFNYQRFRN